MSKELVDYFIKATDKRFIKLETKIDQLLEFKWKVYGMALACGVIGAGLGKLIITILGA